MLMSRQAGGEGTQRLCDKLCVTDPLCSSQVFYKIGQRNGSIVNSITKESSLDKDDNLEKIVGQININIQRLVKTIIQACPHGAQSFALSVLLVALNCISLSHYQKTIIFFPHSTR